MAKTKADTRSNYQVEYDSLDMKVRQCPGFSIRPEREQITIESATRINGVPCVITVTVQGDSVSYSVNTPGERESKCVSVDTYRDTLEIVSEEEESEVFRM